MCIRDRRGHAPQYFRSAPVLPGAARAVSPCRAQQATGLREPFYSGGGTGCQGLCHAPGGFIPSHPRGGLSGTSRV
eukprot:723334-Alexandrium_andersonii.AAC.1